ncbi:uncharacterized protein JN550_001430 [Neoarthrinium moseri]|uniref:uncharacterized protein n=1 Tax=Neoarthrinium moseri TaxID=1658444 RepID=UPI001FDCBEBA|nr:uncharacterized protein JN550_001430 [Neoarthrinium moseri]KAI1875934.1 hypothetical protein JN550_001430 [Neoarthrinium moseri]
MPPNDPAKESVQTATEQEVPGGFARDDATLARLGKRPVLKRNFGFWTILGFSCTILITWEGSLIVFLSGLQNGGPSGILYGFILVWIGTISVFATLSELASMAPTSGGQYHWVSMMAPTSYRRFLSFITGWLTLTGWQAATASGAYLTGTAIQGLILLTHPDYLDTMQNWHEALMFVQMSEEVRNPAVTVPWSLMIGLCINGVLGFAMLIATMYCMGDIEMRLEENPIYPFMAIFYNAVGSLAGATVMSAFVVILAFSATTGLVSSTSRVYWAFARDRRLPGWRILKKVSRRTSIPVYCVMITVTVSIILSLINIGSATAFNGVISISVAGLFGSYLAQH